MKHLTKMTPADKRKAAYNNLQLSKASMSALQLGYVATTPPTYQTIYVSSLTGKASPRQAIKAKCLECVGFEDVKNAVGGCTCFRCPLWFYRPYQESGAQDETI